MILARVIRVGLGTVAAVVLLAGCSSHPTGTAPTGHARHWLTVNSQLVRVMRGDAANLELTADTAEASSYIAPLGTAIAEVERVLPAPDVELNHHLWAACSAYAVGAQDVARQQLTLATSALQQGDREVKAADARAKQLGHGLYAYH